MSPVFLKMIRAILLIIFLLFPRIAKAELVSWWKLDEASWNGTAGEAVDSYGTNHGTASGGATTKVGKIDRAGSFDGNDDYVSVPNAASLNITGALTLELWMKSSSLVGNDGGLISKSNDTQKYFGTAIKKVYELGILNNIIYFQIGNGTTESLLGGSSTALINNVWHHVVATWDGTTNPNSQKIYFDGVLKYNMTATISSIQILSSILDIGGYTTIYNFNGLIDEVRIYNHALTAAEVAQAYYEGANTRLRHATIR